MDTKMNSKRIWIFLAFAFGIPWAAAVAFYLSGMLASNPGQAVTLVNYIFISSPALANVATRLFTREGFKHLWLRPNFRRGWKFYLAAWLLPLLATIIGCLAFYLIFPQSFDPNANRARDQIVIFRSAIAASPWIVMLAFLLEKMVVQGLFISLFTIGEEFGWRAYLQQKLGERFGSYRKTALLIGLIWAVWHMPLLFMGLGTDPGITDTRVIPIFALIYPLSTISSSILLAWVTLRSGSMWPAAIGHATLLGVGGLAMGMLKGPIDLIISPNPQSLIGNLGFILLALVLYFNHRGLAVKDETGQQKVQAEYATLV